MIITKTPFRVSFFGGGTDYPDWYTKHGGAFLSMAIDKYCYLSIRHLPPFFSHKHRLVYSVIEMVSEINEFKHPVVRETLKWKGCDSGLEIHHDGDLPARSGLGSSSAFTVGFLHALSGLRGQLVQKRDLAEEAIYVEQKLLGETVGVQDQIAAAYGGLNSVKIETTGLYSITPIMVTSDLLAEFESHILLCFTGISRYASEVAIKKVASFDAKQDVLLTMRDMVKEGEELICSGEFGKFGKLLHESWMLKRSISDVISDSSIDEMYKRALKAGALGGKLLGAGGGGFMLLFVSPSLQDQVRASLPDSIFVSVKVEWSGSQVAFYQKSDC